MKSWLLGYGYCGRCFAITNITNGSYPRTGQWPNKGGKGRVNHKNRPVGSSIGISKKCRAWESACQYFPELLHTQIDLLKGEQVGALLEVMNSKW